MPLRQVPIVLYIALVFSIGLMEKQAADVKHMQMRLWRFLAEPGFR